MIKRNELESIGKFLKPHGIRGELSFAFTDDAFDEGECPFLICEIDGIFVPFLIEDYRFKSDQSAFVKLKGIDSETQARNLVNREVFFPEKYIIHKDRDDMYSWDYFIGYFLFDHNTGMEIGEITDVDDSTINTLFVVRGKENEILIPAVEDIIFQVDSEKKIIIVDLPEGILSI